MASASLWIYRLLLGGLLPVALPAIKLRQWLAGKSRPRFRDRLGRSLPKLLEDGVWIQAVSVGEVEVARGLVVELEQRAPNLPLFLTATTASGLDLARRTLGDRLPVFPCPIDLPGPVSRVFEAARPRLLVLVETELWPEMLHQAGLREVPVAVVNARLWPERAEGADCRLGQRQVRHRSRPASARMGGRCSPGRGRSFDHGCRIDHGG
jgi:3-deoxy-D-manno-octulosonic-acid transferase